MKHNSHGKSLLVLGGWLALCFAAAAMGGLFPPGEWHAQLRKPSWNPPNWLFGPVWTALYLMMAVAAWLVWREKTNALRTKSLGCFLVQLCLNAAWTPVFFGLHRIGPALVVLLGLVVTLAVTLVFFWRVRPAAGLLLAPYLAWVGFASALNAALWRLNP